MLSPINIGLASDFAIRELVEVVAKVVGYKGQIDFDTIKPDGVKRKLMDVSRLEKLGWSAKVDLNEGLNITYQWFIDNQVNY